ncbi:uncharacterized protein [Montipora capricornis]|uniref:uncharacterized protein n=1 Tax=Montipora capricornis TaxID=246305 RepID=UPI0035F17534
MVFIVVQWENEDTVSVVNEKQVVDNGELQEGTHVEISTGSNKGRLAIYKATILQVFGEKAEVAMAVLPLLLQGKSGMCKHTDFVEFISGEASPRRTAEGRERTFPFLICNGSLESHDRIYLAADKRIICDFEGSLVESALASLATFLCFYLQLSSCTNNFFSISAKMHFAYSRWEKTAILCNFIS